MTTIQWPSTLPDCLQLNGYSESIPDQTIRTNMEYGIAKVRRRSSNAVRPVSGSIVVTKEQLDTLKDFYINTLAGGVLRFAWVEPLDGTTVAEMRFTSPPSYSKESPDIFKVNMELEILP
jgi:hypothetical protein